MGLVQFGDAASVIFRLNTHSRKEDILQDIQRLRYTRGRTYTADALRLIRQDVFTPGNGDRFDVPNYAILITDGESTVEREMTIPEAIEASCTGEGLFQNVVIVDHHAN